MITVSGSQMIWGGQNGGGFSTGQVGASEGIDVRGDGVLVGGMILGLTGDVVGNRPTVGSGVRVTVGRGLGRRVVGASVGPSVGDSVGKQIPC